MIETLAPKKKSNLETLTYVINTSNEDYLELEY